MPGTSKRNFKSRSDEENGDSDDNRLVAKDNSKSPSKQKGEAKGKRKKISTNSPRKLAKRKRTRKELRESVPEEDLEIEENEKEVMANRPEESRETVTVTFKESENEYVEMDVNADQDFLSGGEEGEVMDMESNSEEEEEELEISFNNNATRQTPETKGTNGRSEEMPTNPKSAKISASKEESDEERENRIVNKTVAKLQQLMAAGGYMQHSVVDEDKEVRKAAAEKRKGKEVQNNVKGLEVSQSVSESMIYNNAIEPAGSINNGDNGPLQVSTSSDEEFINTSNESGQSNDHIEQVECFINNVRSQITPMKETSGDPVPSTSRGVKSAVQCPVAVQQVQLLPQQCFENNVSGFVREAE